MNNKFMEESMPVDPMVNSTNSMPTETVISPSFSASKKKTPVLVLILIPVILALLGVIAYEGYLYYQTYLASQESDIVVKPKPTTAVQAPLTLDLESPTEGSLITNNKVLVKGKTLPGAIVTVFSDNQDTSLETDSTGNFIGEITLNNGINTLTITAFGDNGQEKSLEVNLVNDSEI